MRSLSRQIKYADVRAPRSSSQIGRVRTPRGGGSSYSVCNYLTVKVDAHHSDAAYWKRSTSAQESIVDTIVSNASVSPLTADLAPDVHYSAVKMAEIEKGLDQCESDLDSSMNAFNVSASYTIHLDALHVTYISPLDQCEHHHPAHSDGNTSDASRQSCCNR